MLPIWGRDRKKLPRKRGGNLRHGKVDAIGEEKMENHKRKLEMIL